MKKRISSLDLLRLFACFCILAIHFNAVISGWNIYGGFFYSNSVIPVYYVDNRLYLGDIGVSIFFILTGASLMISTTEWKGLAHYFKKRIISIYPSYWIAYLVALSWDFILDKHLICNSIIDFIPSFLGVDGYLGMYIPKLGIEYKLGEWFLGALLILYVLFPILRHFLTKNEKLTIITVFFFYFSYKICERLLGWQINSTLFWLRIPEILVGMIFIKHGLLYKMKNVIMMSFIIFIICYLCRNSISQMTLTFSFCALISAIIISIGEHISSQPINNVIVYLASLTYPCFLVHHWLINHLMSGFDLATITITERYFLFIIYIIITFLLSSLLKKATYYITNFLK